MTVSWFDLWHRLFGQIQTGPRRLQSKSTTRTSPFQRRLQIYESKEASFTTSQYLCQVPLRFKLQVVESLHPTASMTSRQHYFVSARRNEGKIEFKRIHVVAQFFCSDMQPNPPYVKHTATKPRCYTYTLLMACFGNRIVL